MTEILFADDDGAMRQMVSELLRAAGYSVRVAPDGRSALAEIHRVPPELIVLDYRMGEPDGFQVCKELKQDARYAHLPVLILTAQGEQENRLAGFDAGADDYLSKPFDPRELVARVRALLRLTRAGLDRNPTTGLPGGTAVEQEFERRRTLDAPFSICYFDLDHFKPFNDRFGFATADAVIREAGAALSHAASACDGFAAHIGGDDFVALCDPAVAHDLAADARDRFRISLARHLPPDIVQAGSYQGVDREGRERELPITSLAAALVHVEPGADVSLAELGEQVAEAKHRAKSAASGIAETSYPPRPGQLQADRAGGAVSSQDAA